ncbi:hypothetical protein DHEL01_v210659 [Diaporthe helianthi]|uniref:Uncharacterized protein n=1 Tax=Diaporthe helianthi TaxID=158607 RepID=A0A2P5HL42_DIAHE|nr:hypothetical protein DHEL01_v210659 [Diaporthe helianthi]
MTRVTAPREIAKLVRYLSTTSAAPAPSRLIASTSTTASARIRKGLDAASKENAPASERTLTTTTRPTPNPHRVIPLMQGFHTTQAARYAQADVSTIDFMVLPTREQLFGAHDDDASSSRPAVRVPLLPDNFAPDRASFAPEATDAPLPAPEIVVMAADPTSVNAVSPLTEVEAFSPDGVELSFARGWGADRDAPQQELYAGGMLKDLWAGLKEDILSPNGQPKPAL